MEAAQRNNRLFAALKEGNTALQELQKQVALEDVERLNEETEEAREYQEQLRELLGQTLSAQDDAEALEELERIEVCHSSIASLVRDHYHNGRIMIPSTMAISKCILHEDKTSGGFGLPHHFQNSKDRTDDVLSSGCVYE